MNDEELENIENTNENENESFCPKCGLRTYNIVCLNCQTTIKNHDHEENEDYDWREYRK